MSRFNPSHSVLTDLNLIDLLADNFPVVDMFGDSITAGDYNYPNDAQVSYPSVLGDLLMDDTDKTVLVPEDIGSELYNVASSADITVANVTYSAGEYTMTSGATEATPRFQIKAKTPLAAGENYKITMDIDTSAAGGKSVQPKMILYNAGGTALDTVYLKTITNTTSGYANAEIWVNSDYLLIRQPTATQFVLGVGFNSDTTERTVKVKNISCKKNNTNLISTPNIVAEAGVESMNSIVLTSTAGELNPRYLYYYAPLRSADHAFKVSITLDVSQCLGAKVYPRFDVFTTANALCQEITPMAKTYASGSTVTIEFVVSLDYLKRLNPTAARYSAGVRLAATEAGQILTVTSYTVRALSKGVFVNNRAISGETSTEAAARVSTIVSDAPNVCVIGYGTNDLRDSTPLGTLIDNLVTIIAALKAANIVPILSTLPPMSSAQTNYSLVCSWNAAIKRLGIKLNVQVFDRFSAMNNGDTTLLEDGCHPLNTGYALLAKSAHLLLKGDLWQ